MLHRDRILLILLQGVAGILTVDRMNFFSGEVNESYRLQWYTTLATYKIDCPVCAYSPNRAVLRFRRDILAHHAAESELAQQGQNTQPLLLIRVSGIEREYETLKEDINLCTLGC